MSAECKFTFRLKYCLPLGFGLLQSVNNSGWSSAYFSALVHRAMSTELRHTVVHMLHQLLAIHPQGGLRRSNPIAPCMPAKCMVSWFYEILRLQEFKGNFGFNFLPIKASSLCLLSSSLYPLSKHFIINLVTVDRKASSKAKVMTTAFICAQKILAMHKMR